MAESKNKKPVDWIEEQKRINERRRKEAAQNAKSERNGDAPMNPLKAQLVKSNA